MSSQTRRLFQLPEKLTRLASRSLTRKTVVPIALALTLLVAYGDYITDVEIMFTLAYFCPISLGTWFRGRTFGIILAAMATGFAVAIAIQSSTHPSYLTIIWNDGGAFVLFLLLVWMLDRIRRYVDIESEQRRVAVQQLRHADRLTVIGKLAAGVAHELGTPLNVVAGHAELLTSIRRTPEGVEESARTILRQTERMTTIIRHLLDFGRHNGSSKTDVNLDELSATAARMLGATASKTHCKFVIEPSSPPVHVLANASELEQVITNLLMNAVQAMPHGGVVRVRTGVERNAAAVKSNNGARSFGCLSVEDEGVGISESNITRVFDPFFTTKGVGEGTGLGLSVSYGIVTDHGGRIDVKSTVDHGTCFSVRLPLLEAAMMGARGAER